MLLKFISHPISYNYVVEIHFTYIYYLFNGIITHCVDLAIDRTSLPCHSHPAMYPLNLEDEERVSPRDKRDSYHDNRNASRCHRRSTDPETEESYLVLKGSDGKARFVCKKCEATFTSQKSIKQHDMMKHVDPMWPY